MRFADFEPALYRVVANQFPDGTWGDHLEIVSQYELYSLGVWIYEFSDTQKLMVRLDNTEAEDNQGFPLILFISTEEIAIIPL